MVQPRNVVDVYGDETVSRLYMVLMLGIKFGVVVLDRLEKHPEGLFRCRVPTRRLRVGYEHTRAEHIPSGIVMFAHQWASACRTMRNDDSKRMFDFNPHLGHVCIPHLLFRRPISNPAKRTQNLFAYPICQATEDLQRLPVPITSGGVSMLSTPAQDVLSQRSHLSL